MTPEQKFALLCDVVTEQRNQALNALAQAEAEIAVLRQALEVAPPAAAEAS